MTHLISGRNCLILTSFMIVVAKFIVISKFAMVMARIYYFLIQC